MTEFQEKCVKAIPQFINRQANICQLSAYLKTSRLAVYSAMASLEKQGIAGHFRPTTGCHQYPQNGNITYFLIPPPQEQ